MGHKVFPVNGRITGLWYPANEKLGMRSNYSIGRYANYSDTEQIVVMAYQGPSVVFEVGA